MGNARPIDGRPQNEVQVGRDKLEVVASFCYLGDMLSAGGGCEIAVTTRVKTAWKKFRELLPVLASCHLSYKTRGHEIDRDCREWKLTTVDPQERSTWRSGVRSAMRAASQLPGKGPTDVDDAPAPAH